MKIKCYRCKEELESVIMGELVEQKWEYFIDEDGVLQSIDKGTEAIDNPEAWVYCPHCGHILKDFDASTEEIEAVLTKNMEDIKDLEIDKNWDIIIEE
ncbi:MAG TPA: hypothetical protein PLK41_04515 [Defluviitoga tunisiensis]|nr:hypothetical protein [bacterium]HPP10234.1 hypothetical protein [Defluviitoga tunisiensis]